MKQTFTLFLLILFILLGCNDSETEFLFPKKYFPAYPESYWVYSDGTMTKVAPGYHKHNYYENLESNITSETVYVPMIDNKYVYQYSITQNDNRIPLKKLLSERNGDDWLISSLHPSGELRRTVIEKDTTVTLSAPVANNNKKIFDSCIVVIEYYKDSIVNPWQTKEIYAPGVGLIRQEIRRGNDSLVAKELINYYISEAI